LEPIMRFLAIVGSGVLAFSLIWQWRVDAEAQAQNSQTDRAREPVVVELFTSEGCSSCPPADSFVAQLDAQQLLGSAQIIALEEHVDYWDEQGWKDPFSSSTWTARQRDYAGTLRNGNPYTPQMVVDGTAGFVGSQVGTARQEIEKAAAAKKSKVEITRLSLDPGKSVSLNVNVEKLGNLAPKDTAEVILAISESGLHSAVKAGENNGKELQHSPVVRELKVIGVMGKNGNEGFAAQPAVKLDAKWNTQNLRAVVFVQERKNRRILAAAAIRLAQ